MKGLKSIVSVFIVITFFTLVTAFKFRQDANPLNGAWIYQDGSDEEVLMFVDGYFTHTGYSSDNKKFIFTHGGPYTLHTNKFAALIEFDTRNKDRVGDTLRHLVTIADARLTIDTDAGRKTFKRVDEGLGALAGAWRITARKQGDDVVPIHQTGTRKTLKILSGTRFQWVAIDPGKKDFSGTGGGTYIFENGKYTEKIEFFSRDSSRVGASLSFDGKVRNGDWHHSGKSSKGDPIYEVWGRIGDQ